jgi:glutaconyl-CoA/methylmalonyl-CoA decarboxylase subunit delta
MENLGFGLWMTAMGMGTVFALLLLLMLVLRAIGWVDKRAAARNAAPVMPSFDLEEEPKASPDGLTSDEIAAITIAVITHARVRRGQAAPAMRQVQPGSQLFASRWVAVGRSYQNQPWKTR